MNERIKEIRKVMQLNQTEFGEKIGVKQGTVAGYENGSRTPLDAVITAICREFNVSEIWLRTGEGEMFVDLGKDAELTQILAEIQVSDDDTIKDMLVAYWGLDEKEKAAIRKLIDGMVRRQKERAERQNHPADS